MRRIWNNEHLLHLDSVRQLRHCNSGGSSELRLPLAVKVVFSALGANLEANLYNSQRKGPPILTNH
jgi:hypothetical protein